MAEVSGGRPAKVACRAPCVGQARTRPQVQSHTCHVPRAWGLKFQGTPHMPFLHRAPRGPEPVAVPTEAVGDQWGLFPHGPTVRPQLEACWALPRVSRCFRPQPLGKAQKRQEGSKGRDPTALTSDSRWSPPYECVPHKVFTIWELEALGENTSWCH